MPRAESDLGDLLAKALPADVRIAVRHISSTPQLCAALFAVPSGTSPETTFCENHYLSVSANSDDQDGQEIIVFGMEVLIYSTADLTTIFVSKADSTGYLHNLRLPPRVPLLRLISDTFLSFLVRTRQREGVRLAISLFARAQNQYLFPGSIHSPGKHVLDDRSLIKWWCRTVDTILRQYRPESVSDDKEAIVSANGTATAFLIVPGCDKSETRSFFPKSVLLDDPDRPRWVNEYPLHQLCKDRDAPPRCLIPRFPDDPKSRLLIDLDDELPDIVKDGPVHSGQWRSVKSLDQFWDMMSFRQECSAGRLVGFLWVVISPLEMLPLARTMKENRGLLECPKSDILQSAHIRGSSPSDQPREECVPASKLYSRTSGHTEVQSCSYPFYWPEAGRGHVVLSEADYKAAMEFLMDREFHDEKTSVDSTKAWVDKIASLSDQLIWGQDVMGINTTAESTTSPTRANSLKNDMVRKRKVDQGEPESQMLDPAESKLYGVFGRPDINMLNASVIRKKKKT